MEEAAAAAATESEVQEGLNLAWYWPISFWRWLMADIFWASIIPTRCKYSSKLCRTKNLLLFMTSTRLSVKISHCMSLFMILRKREKKRVLYKREKKQYSCPKWCWWTHLIFIVQLHNLCFQYGACISNVTKVKIR